MTNVIGASTVNGGESNDSDAHRQLHARSPSRQSTMLFILSYSRYFAVYFGHLMARATWSAEAALRFARADEDMKMENRWT